MQRSLCDVPGIRVGHQQNESARTGCTVILPNESAVAGVDARGSAPGTREVELLHPTRLVQSVNAILLCGGSAFGLAAADGVVNYLHEQNIGFDTGVARVPIVPAAVIFDLAHGDASNWPDTEMGYQSCQVATSQYPREGRIGAGCGATVAKAGGPDKVSFGGIGTWSEELPGGVVVGVLTVVNAFGEIVNPDTGEIIAGVKSSDEPGFNSSLELLKEMQQNIGFQQNNTTLSVVATNAALDRQQLTKVAQMGQNGIARSVRPSHTMMDGDIVFALSTGDKVADVSIVGAFACEIVARSVVRAVQNNYD